MNASQVLSQYAENVDFAGSGNVYDAISLQLRYRLYSLPYPCLLSRSMYPVMAVYAAQAALLLCSLVLRVWDWRSFWLFRRVPDPKGNFAFTTPHYGIVWQFSTLAFLLCLQAFGVYTVRWTQARHSDSFIMWTTLCWLGSWLSAWMVVWSLAVGQAVKARTKRASFLNDPRLVNFIFIFTTFLVIIGMIVIAAVCSRAYNHAMHLYLRVQRALNALADTSATDSPQVAMSKLQTDIVPLFQAHLNNYSDFLPLWRATWVAWAGFTTYLYIIFSIVSFIYFNSLRQSLAQLTRDSASLPHDSFARSRSLLHSAFTSSLTIAICGGGAGLGWVVVSLLVAFQAPFPRDKWLTGEILTGCYGFAILGSIGCLFSLERSFASLPPEKQRTLKRWLCCGRSARRGESSTCTGTHETPPVAMQVALTIDAFGVRGITREDLDENDQEDSGYGRTQDQSSSDEKGHGGEGKVEPQMTALIV